jgi:hypothetical protein
MFIKTIDLFCDTCSEWVPGENNNTAAQVRKFAKKRGWILLNAKDYCPECVHEWKEEEKVK